MNDEDLRDLFAAFAMISKAWIPYFRKHERMGRRNGARRGE